MKNKKLIKIAGVLLAIAIPASAAIADYSGVFQATVSSYKVSVGITKGGRLTGGGFYNVEDADVVNPAYSYVRSDGTFTGKTLGGKGISGKVSKSGTAYVMSLKALGKTSTLKRTYQ